MAARMTPMRWLGSEFLDLPPDVVENISSEDHTTYVKGIMVCAMGDGEISPQEREWITGYLRTCGDSEDFVESMEAYDGSDTIEDLATRTPNMRVYRRSMLYDALRACASDGDLSDGERERVLSAADRMGVSRDVVSQLEQIVQEERALRKRRHDVIVAAAFAESSG